jgi:hypothetical protein
LCSGTMNISGPKGCTEHKSRISLMREGGGDATI